MNRNARRCKVKIIILFSCGYRKKRDEFLHMTRPHQSLDHMHEHTPLDDLIIEFPFHMLWDLYCPAVAQVRNHLRWLGVIRRPFWCWCSTWISGRPCWHVGKLLVFAPKLFSSACGAPFLGLFVAATESKIFLSRISSG